MGELYFLIFIFIVVKFKTILFKITMHYNQEEHYIFMIILIVVKFKTIYSKIILHKNMLEFYFLIHI